MRKLMFIKNIEQANFFLKEGLIPLRLKIEDNNKRVAVIFNRDTECERIFGKWVNLNR